MRKSRTDTANQPETQWTGRLIELACKSKAADLVRLGEDGERTQDEFNRICQDKRMRADDGGDTPGEIAVYIGWLRDPITKEELRRAHYLGSRAFFFVDLAAVAGLEWWVDALSERFEIVEIEDNGSHIIGVAKPMALIGEIKTKGAVPHEQRIHNMRLNCRHFRRRLSPRNFTGNTMPPHGRKAILACAGPSLAQSWGSIKMDLDISQGETTLATCSTAYRFLMDKGIRPHMHLETDPRPHKVEQILPIEPQGTEFYLSSCVDMLWQDHVPESQVVLWHANFGPESVEAADKYDPGFGMINGGGSIGLRSICVLYFLGYRHIQVHGMDCSFAADGAQHVNAHLGKPMPEIEVTNGKRKFRSSPVMVAYAQYFGKLVELLPDAEIYLAGDGLLQSMYGKRQ